jgi:tripartite-type tricarboxylate transporter receptor subunit TctC
MVPVEMEATMNVKLGLFTLLLLLTLVWVFAASERFADAANYPVRPVKIVVPYPAGGPMDVTARIVAQKLTERIGGQFYVENQPGAGGTIGTGAAALAPPDGQTILIANQDFVVEPIVKAKVPFDPFKSFTPVIEVATAPEMIVVNPALPATSMKELFALLKANPGKYSYASPGYGTSPHLACEWLFKLSQGLDVIHVPFQGALPAVTSTLAGQTPILHILVPAVAPYIKNGTLRPLAVASHARAPVIPDVPTLEEAGVPGHEVGFWFGALVPTGTPKEIVELLHHNIAEIIAQPDFKERLGVLGFDAVAGTSQEFARHIRAESDRWSGVVSEAHIKIN